MARGREAGQGIHRHGAAAQRWAARIARAMLKLGPVDRYAAGQAPSAWRGI